MTKALLVAGTRSGSGKTTLTAGLVAAFKRRGLDVRAAKSGPDYIDPGFHAAASGAPCFNLDAWAMQPPLLNAVMAESAGGADLLILESAMGLFDGALINTGKSGSAAELAAHFGIPVLLIVDVTSQAQSVAALVHGFATYDSRIQIAGVVLNRVASARHRDVAAESIGKLSIPVLGALPQSSDIQLRERHLGLVQATERADIAALIAALADMVERSCDLNAVATIARPLHIAGSSHVALNPPGQQIALASDAAFSFVYPHVVNGWRQAGAEVVGFSPLADEAPPESCDSCWLPGGYPELHAGTLAGATRFKQGLARFAAKRPVHGECGGYMVLGTGLVDANGDRHAMAGLLSHATSFADRRLHLGYRRAELLADCALGAAGSRFRGHEFHYASLIEPGVDIPLLQAHDAPGNKLGLCGGRRGHVTGSFFHVIALEGGVALGAQLSSSAAGMA